MTRVSWNFFPGHIDRSFLDRERRYRERERERRLSFFISHLGRRKRINGLIAWHRRVIRSRASFNRRLPSVSDHIGDIRIASCISLKQYVRQAFIDSWLCTGKFLRLLCLEKKKKRFNTLRSLLRMWIDLSRCLKFINNSLIWNLYSIQFPNFAEMWYFKERLWSITWE